MANREEEPLFRCGKGSIVFLIKNSMPGGGAEKQSLILAQGLFDLGFSVKIFTQIFDKKHIEHLAPTVPSISSYKELLRIERPCLLISFLKMDHFSCALLKFFGFKWVPFERIYPTYYEIFSRGSHIRRTVSFWVHRSIYRLWSDGLLVQTKGSAQAWANRFGYSKSIWVVPNAYQSDARQRRLKNSKEPFIVAFVGRLIAMKDPMLAVDAVKKLVENYRQNCQLWIFGVGPLQPILEDYIEKFGLSQVVKLLGFEVDIRSKLCMADAFIMTSHMEGMPNSLGEAMALGLPCVVTDFPGGAYEMLGESISEHKGQIVEGRDPEKMAKMLKKIADDPDFSQLISIQNLGIIRTKFSKTEVFSLLSGTIQTISERFQN